MIEGSNLLNFFYILLSVQRVKCALHDCLTMSPSYRAHFVYYLGTTGNYSLKGNE